MRCLRSLPAILALVVAVPAGGAPLGLLEAMRLARDQAPEVAAAGARQEAGAQRLRQARGARLPTVTLSELWMRTDSPAEVFALELNQERFDFQSFVASDPNDPDPIAAATTRLELTLPLYTGGELTARIGQAERAVAAADRAADWAADQAALQAGTAWLDLAQAREQVALLERSLATVDAHVELAAAYVEEGMIVRSELLRAEVERARIQDLLIEARGGARVAEANLSFRLGVLQGSAWELPALPPPAPLPAERAAWLAGSARRGDVERVRHLVEAAELASPVERAALRPRVALAARHDLVDDTPFGTHGDASAVMAMASIELFAGGRHRAAAAAAEAEAAAARHDLARLEQAVELAARQAWEEAGTARERLRTAETSLEAAREAERITEERFAQGVVRTIDLLDAATARREAETRALVARVHAHRTALDLAVKAGRRPEALVPGGPDPSSPSPGGQAPRNTDTTPANTAGRPESPLP